MLRKLPIGVALAAIGVSVVASAATGRGKAFGLHEALDSAGGLLGPLLFALVLALLMPQLTLDTVGIPAAQAAGPKYQVRIPSVESCSA